jgi:hypothetical protein
MSLQPPPFDEPVLEKDGRYTPRWSRFVLDQHAVTTTNAPATARYVIEGGVNVDLPNAQALGALSTGIVKVTTTTGALSVAAAGDFPTLNQNTTGSAAKLTTPRNINAVAFDGSANITIYPTVVAGPPASRSTTATAAVSSVLAYTVGGADGSFEISANVNVTTSTTHNFTVTCTYTDETNTSRTLTLGFVQLAGATLLTAITNGTGAGPYESLRYHLRCKAGTSITVATTGTFTTVTYNVEAVLAQVA